MVYTVLPDGTVISAATAAEMAALIREWRESR
jgi:hypothetical protein